MSTAMVYLIRQWTPAQIRHKVVRLTGERLMDNGRELVAVFDQVSGYALIRPEDLATVIFADWPRGTFTEQLRTNLFQEVQ